jgi:hypothetical protein
VHRRLLVAAVSLAVLAPAAVVGASTSAGGHSTVGHSTGAQGVTAQVSATGAVLRNASVSRTWRIDPAGAVTTTGLTGAGGHSWVRPGPDFSLTVDGVPTTSASVWRLADVTVQQPVELPNRPRSGLGAALQFRYVLPDPAAPLLELDRTVALRPGTSVFQTTTTLLSRGPAARVSAYSLDEVVAAEPGLPAEVHAYHGGSDWRDDYRAITREPAAFDVEGEVARFGTDSGYLLVSQRRGGVMSRVGRDASGRSWVGVDWPRDAFDFGPLRTDPPDYNRLDNPAYPVPVRARVLPALGELDLGTSYLGTYRGGSQEAAAAFAAAFVGAAMPDFPRGISLNSFHPWNHGPGLSDPNLRSQVDLAARLGVETFMLDDQWQGGPGGESGDWQWDAERFPDGDDDGVPDLVTYLQDQGLRLGLWMSPLEFHTSSVTYQQHPEWACTPVGHLTAQVPDDAGLGVWDATNRGFQDYIVGVVDRLVRDFDVHEFKFDFMAWVDCVSADPAGVHDYADYEQAFVDIVRRMQQRHPSVTFELDETNDQRSWPFESVALGPSWFDNGHLHGSTAVAKLLHDVWTAAPWVPAWSLGVGTYDGTLRAPYDAVAGVDFLAPLALLTHVTTWTDLTTLSPAQQDETAWWFSWYRAHRDAMGSVVYELTGEDPLGGDSWAAWQPWNGESGYVFAFRQADAAAPSVTVSLHGLQAQRHYRLTDVRSGAELGVRTGAQLAAGYPIALAPATAQVLAVDPV